eukprot:9055362-Alexandrium_andersonii.AAC.1
MVARVRCPSNPVAYREQRGGQCQRAGWRRKEARVVLARARVVAGVGLRLGRPRPAGRSAGRRDGEGDAGAQQDCLRASHARWCLAEWLGWAGLFGSVGALWFVPSRQAQPLQCRG